jgi:hypothetical protein
MNFLSVMRDYHAARIKFSQCQPNTKGSLFKEKFEAFISELHEFKEEPSFDEFFDMLHSLGDLVFITTGLPLHYLALPTVYKHTVRYRESGCMRSARNCCQNQPK